MLKDVIILENQEYREILIELADIFKALSHPTRLCIVTNLMLENRNVNQMQNCLNMPQSTVSQHLSILKSQGIIKGNRKGTEVIYSISDERVKFIIQNLIIQKNITK